MPLLNNFFQVNKISVVDKNKSIKYLPVDNSDSDSDSVVEYSILIDNQCEFKKKTNIIMMLNRNNTRRNYSSNFDIGQQASDLMTKNTRRNWRKLFAGGLIALVVLLLLIATLFLLKLNPDEGNSQTTTTSSITLDEWLWGSLSTKNFNGTWINDDEILYRDESDNLMIYNIENDVSKVLLPMTNPALSSSFDYVLSPDKKYLLLASNYQKFYRHTYLAQYKIVNLATFNETSLSVGNSTTPATLQLATWAPKGNGLIYVYLSNIYYRPEAEIPIDYQITTTGDYGSIYNAVPDWVYEEEVFSSNKALWFSPSGKKMAFGFFNDTKSHLMTIPYYGYPGSLSFQYPSAIPVHYPKSGTVNPTVKLFYIDLEMVSSSRGNNISLIEIQHPPQLSGKERILAAVTFPTENIISATWMNRVQNQAYFQLYNVEKSSYNTALEYIERNGWVEQFEAPHFSKDGKKFLLILPQKQLDHDHWSHLVMVTNMNNNSRTIRALTSGTFVVTEISGWDEENSLVYYLATVADDPAQQHLYRVSTLDENSKPECLSCNVKSENGEKLCLYNEAKLSPSRNRFILTCAGPDVPDVSIYNSDNSTKLLTWESNSRVANVIKEKSRPIVKRFTVRVPGDFDAQVRLLIPPGADLTGAKKYPMLVYVYGGPDSYQVTEKFNVDWGTYLSTNKNIIYAAIDGRGSGLKGNAMLFSGYRNLGTVEIYDQINVTRHIQMNYPFVDKEKTAIWGWSYGGYATGMSLAMDKEGVFKCGMSVAPVTDWALYDSIYTERFMGLPTVADNLGGYEQGQLLNKVDNIKSNSYYLIHGTLDDNVHYQQSLLLAKVLEQKDILFRQQTYTDEDHGILQSRAHLYHSMENFLNDCLIKS